MQYCIAGANQYATRHSHPRDVFNELTVLFQKKHEYAFGQFWDQFKSFKLVGKLIRNFSL
jgi:hypothetical protein